MDDHVRSESVLFDGTLCWLRASCCPTFRVVASRLGIEFKRADAELYAG
jgi:hypothetical protein